MGISTRARLNAPRLWLTELWVWFTIFLPEYWRVSAGFHSISVM
jgi:hypothetical protein